MSLPHPLEPATIRAQMQRMLDSGLFRRRPRVSAFFRHIVEETLAGRQSHVKEYSIAVTVFERPDNFDPRLDSIVRVEARRLRATIAQYYATDGVNDAVRIEVRTGNYVPTFRLRQPGDGVTAVGGSMLVGVVTGSSADVAAQAAVASQGTLTVLRLPFTSSSVGLLQQPDAQVFFVQPASADDIARMLASAQTGETG